MAFNVKTFGMVSALMGGCIGLPWYLLQTGKNSSSVTQVPMQSTTATTSMESEDAEPTEKVSCEVSDASQVSQYLSGFSESQSEFYSSVSCKNNTFKGDSDSLLGKEWMGLFPKNVLEEKLELKGETTFEISVETSREEGSGGTSTLIVFSNPETKSSVRGKLGEIKEEKSSKRSVVVSLEGSGQWPRKIYLLVDSSSDEQADDTTH